MPGKRIGRLLRAVERLVYPLLPADSLKVVDRIPLAVMRDPARLHLGPGSHDVVSGFASLAALCRPQRPPNKTGAQVGKVRFLRLALLSYPLPLLEFAHSQTCGSYCRSSCRDASRNTAALQFLCVCPVERVGALQFPLRRTHFTSTLRRRANADSNRRQSKGGKVRRPRSKQGTVQCARAADTNVRVTDQGAAIPLDGFFTAMDILEARKLLELAHDVLARRARSLELHPTLLLAQLGGHTLL